MVLAATPDRGAVVDENTITEDAADAQFKYTSMLYGVTDSVTAARRGAAVLQQMFGGVTAGVVLDRGAPKAHIVSADSAVEVEWSDMVEVFETMVDAHVAIEIDEPTQVASLRAHMAVSERRVFGATVRDAAGAAVGCLFVASDKEAALQLSMLNHTAALLSL